MSVEPHGTTTRSGDLSPVEMSEIVEFSLPFHCVYDGERCEMRSPRGFPSNK